VPFGVVSSVAELGDAANSKPVIGATNALAANMSRAVGLTSNGADELQ